MPESDDFPLARRTLGTAIITGASGAGLALSLARPWVNEGIEIASMATEEVRKASFEGARTGVSSAIEAGGPTLKNALEAKDRLRRRAVGSLPPRVGRAVEEWRSQFIAGEKAAYRGSLRLAADFQPTLELARVRSKDLLKETVQAFEDVAEVALATSIKFGEEMQSGELPKPPRPAPGALKPKAAARKRPGKPRA